MTPLAAAPLLLALLLGFATGPVLARAAWPDRHPGPGHARPALAARTHQAPVLAAALQQLLPGPEGTLAGAAEDHRLIRLESAPTSLPRAAAWFTALSAAFTPVAAVAVAVAAVPLPC